MDRTPSRFSAQPATGRDPASRHGGDDVLRRPQARMQRDFGVGYGRSSGYASQPSYVAAPAPFFRCR